MVTPEQVKSYRHLECEQLQVAVRRHLQALIVGSCFAARAGYSGTSGYGVLGERMRDMCRR